MTSPVTGTCSSSLPARLTRQSLPPSLIFAGPEGVGKRTAALALAQVLNCPRLFG